jgi:hypothetical protein
VHPTEYAIDRVELSTKLQHFEILGRRSALRHLVDAFSWVSLAERRKKSPVQGRAELNQPIETRTLSRDDHNTSHLHHPVARQGSWRLAHIEEQAGDWSVIHAHQRQTKDVTQILSTSCGMVMSFSHS